MKKVSIATTKQSRNFSEQQLTIDLDLGDRSSWYCGLDEAGKVLLEQRVGTTPKAMREVFGKSKAETPSSGDCVNRLAHFHRAMERGR